MKLVLFLVKTEQWRPVQFHEKTESSMKLEQSPEKSESYSWEQFHTRRIGCLRLI